MEGKVGLVMPEDDADNTLGLGVIADLGAVIPNLDLEGCIDYFGNFWEALGYKSSFKIIGIGATVMIIEVTKNV